MELNITRFFAEAAPKDYSASRAEIGENAGPDTWRAACDDSPDYMLLDTDEKREAFREFVGQMGAWDDEEIAAWSDIELNALCIQFISGDMRDAGLEAGASSLDWQAYKVGCENGTYSGRLYGVEDGEVFYSLD
jgi:hypothetical protein